MLVLARRKDEQITIGDNIVISILRITQNQVYLGIEAPRKIPVHRKEVQDLIDRQRAWTEGDDAP